MTESVIFPLGAMVFGPVVYDVVWEINPTISFFNFWDTLSSSYGFLRRAHCSWWWHGVQGIFSSL